MATLFAPQYREPNAELKQYMLQFAQMMGDKRTATAEQAKVKSFAESISPPDISMINDQRLFSPGGQESLQAALFDGGPAAFGQRPGQQTLSPQQILQKALTAEVPMQEALQLAQSGRKPLTPTQIAQQRSNLWLQKQPADVQEKIYRTKAGLDKPTEKQKYQNQVQYWIERGSTPEEAMENVKTASEISAGFKARANAINKLKDKPLPDQLKFWQNLQSSSQGRYFGYKGIGMKNQKVAKLAGENVKRILEEMKGISAGTGTTTAEKLRKLGTKAAYEKGKKLGYWE